MLASPSQKEGRDERFHLLADAGRYPHAYRPAKGDGLI